MPNIPLLASILFALTFTSFPSIQDNAILGKWHGTSICVDREFAPACKDEEVLYDFTKTAGGKVHLKADKIIAGKPELMGEMDFTYEASTKTWISEFQNQRYHGLWRFEVAGKRITGTLVDVPSKKVVRRIAVERQ